MSDAIATPFLFEREFGNRDVRHGDGIRNSVETGIGNTGDTTLEAAWREGHEKGLEDGFARAVAGIEKRTEEALVTISAQLSAHVVAGEQSQELALSAVSRLAMAIARPLVGNLLEKAPSEPIAELISHCLGRIYGEDTIIVHVPPELEENLRSRLDLVATVGGTTLVQIKIDPSLANSDCKVEWQNGRAEHNQLAIWQEIEQAIERCSIGVDPDAISSPNDRATAERGMSPTTPTREASLPPEHNANDASRRSAEETPDSDIPRHRDTLREDTNETLAQALGPEIRDAERLVSDPEQFGLAPEETALGAGSEG